MSDQPGSGDTAPAANQAENPSAGGDVPITNDLVREITDRVYRLMRRDMEIEVERTHMAGAFTSGRY